MCLPLKLVQQTGMKGQATQTKSVIKPLETTYICRISTQLFCFPSCVNTLKNTLQFRRKIHRREKNLNASPTALGKRDSFCFACNPWREAAVARTRVRKTYSCQYFITISKDACEISFQFSVEAKRDLSIITYVHNSYSFYTLDIYEQLFFLLSKQMAGKLF